MKQNIFRILLSAALLMCCMSVWADLGTPPNDEIWYTTTDGQVCNPYKTDVFGATIRSNNYANGHGTIKFDGDVTSIGKNAFWRCSSLTSITIPSGVTSIGESAFHKCSSLTSVSIPNSVTSIEESTFYGCSSLTSISIPNSIKNIGKSAFYECSSLTSVSIPGSVTSIGNYAFEKDENLTDIFFLGDDDITVGEDCFNGTPATIYVADVTKFSDTWGGRPVKAWRSGEGDGTEDNPYQIATLENLMSFANHVNAGNATACAILTADITMNTGVIDSNGDLYSGAFMEWTPIGGWTNNGYSGEFDGNGHTISGLYFNGTDENGRVGLFGKTDQGANIHDLGVKDSYFRGNIWVAGICGDFASGTIENCWNGATVIGCHSSPCAGGIAGSCWKNASVSGCYNIGKISVESGCSDSQCGGICGIVAKNTSVTYSLSNCVSLKGKCEKAYNVYTENYNYSGLLPNESYSSIGNASVSNVYNDKDASDFASGKVCWLLNGNQRSTTWRQHLGTDDYPMVTGDYLIYYDDDNREYLNETMCEHTENHLHTFEQKTMAQPSGTIINYWHCTACGKDYQFYNRAYELPETGLTQPSAGDGSQANPYQIATLGNLLWFAEHVNSGNASACAKLTADITMNASVLDSDGRPNGEDFVEWTPIGGQNGKDFAGEFNGDGHTISGLYLKNTNTSNVGLFGKAVDNAHIHDLGVIDSYFYGNNHVGGICGDFASGLIENCRNASYVRAYSYNAGGISGSCWKYASVANCYNTGEVSVYTPKGGTEDPRFGGICGSVYSSNATYSIDNCYTLSKVECNKIYGLLAEGCPESKVHDSYVKKAAAFTGGEVCYRLNRGVTNGGPKWFQTLGSDPSPVLNNSHSIVFYGYEGNVLKYSNSQLTIPTAHHGICAATCNAVGYSQECWEDTNSGKIYTETACLHELNQAAVISYIPSAADPTYLINQGDVTGWTQETNQTYDGVNFGYAAVKVFEDYDGTNDNYGPDEWVSFKMTEANAQNARLKWSWTRDEAKEQRGRYGRCTMTYKVNDGAETEITLPSTPFEVSPDVYVMNLGDLSQNDVVEFHIKDYYTAISPPCEVTWAVTLEYVSGHNPEHVAYKEPTCTENGNKENWHCTKCGIHFTDAGCTTVMADWEIPALGHTTEYRAQKAATCTEDGYTVNHWHCTVCGRNYADEACTIQIMEDVVLPKINHQHKQHHDRLEATCLTDGNIEYWHCPDCDTHYTDEACTTPTTEITIAALGHDFISHTPYTTSTCTSEGVVEHWHCSRCGHDFDTGEQTASEDHVIDGNLTVPLKVSDVILVGMDDGQTIDECHTFTPPAEETTTVATVTFGDEGTVTMEVADGEPASYTIADDKSLETYFSHTFKLTAGQDPANTSDYYVTFYTSEGAYKVPETATAYTGTLNNGQLETTSVGGIIHKSEAVMLKAGQSDITIMPSCNKTAASEGNDLVGTDKGKTLGEGDFALSFGDNGVAFYSWAGKSIGDNEAYLTGGPDVESIAIVMNGDTWVRITEHDDNTVTIYGVKGVEFFKENGTPSVRVTRIDDSTNTYTNPKKVDFGK